MGFEPTIPLWSIHTFQACAFDHSATSLNYRECKEHKKKWSLKAKANNY
jgi:hypothetical protein